MVKRIELTQGYTALVSDEDFEWLTQWKWCVSSSGYAVRGERRNGVNRAILMHREIAKRMGLAVTQGAYVDHADRDRLHNCRPNLRLATPTESSYNIVKVNRTGYRGVLHVPYYSSDGKRHPRQKPWQARIRFDGSKKQKSLGYYATAEEAARAYDEAAKKHHGEFATLNFPQEVK